MIGAHEARIANWVTSALAIIILLCRLAAQRHSRRPLLDASSALCALSIVTLVGRVVVNYYTLSLGTANDALIKGPVYLATHSASNIRTGSILSLVARVLITTFYWLQISLLLLFYSGLIKSIRWVTIMIKVCWATIVISYVAVVLATFFECHPFRLYWQILPNPNMCTRAYIQLFLQGGSNIILDLMLLAISWPLLRCSNRSWSQHLRVGLLFLLGTFCIIVTCIRVGSIYGQRSAQDVRSFWASIQLVVATFVANAPTIYGMLKVKKRRQSEQTARRVSRPEEWPSSCPEDRLLSRPSPFLTRPENIATPTLRPYNLVYAYDFANTPSETNQRRAMSFLG